MIRLHLTDDTMTDRTVADSPVTDDALIHHASRWAERRQLLLPFSHEPGYDSRDFLAAGSNQEALSWLETAWPDQRIALWGPDGCGKSHLLHVWAERIGATMLTGRLLTDQTLQDLAVTPESGAVALDDADTVVSESLLLHVLNTARERNLRVLLSGRTAPSRWPFRLADLSSRLRAITAVEIRAPEDHLLAALLLRLLSDRQLIVTQPVQDWLLARLPRSPAALRQAVNRLDQASLAVGKAITRSLATKVLADDGFAITNFDRVSLSGVDPSSQLPDFL